MDLGLVGKVATISGGSGGIGRAVAFALAAEGATVSIAGRNPQRLEETESALGGEFGIETMSLAVDLAEPGGPDFFISETAARFGRVDVLVNAAGSTMRGTIEELTDEDWETALALKFMGAVRAIRAVMPVMKQQGSGAIVNVSGVAGWQPNANQLTIGSVNAALFALTRALSREAAEQGVRVNAVAPGPTEGARFQGWIRSIAEHEGVTSEQAKASILAHVPARRPAEPHEVAAAAVFLASKAASHINGAVLEVDGGEVRGLH